jgi:DNA (cytosine-5)-methyltransferase 1
VGNQILIRNVPSGLRTWIESQSRENRVSRQEVILSILRMAWEGEQLPLFAPAPQPRQPEELSVLFRFVDLFAGIGGFRLALERLGGKCVFSSDVDKYAQRTYKHWFGETPHGDIRKIKPSEIPDHDLLAGGFPCQPFSIAGVSKKKSLGHPHGFKCITQGNLFFDLATIVQAKRPPILLLENVKNLKSHDKGRTWQVIRGTLEDLKYVVFHKVIDASAWVPQHRERIYIVCFDRKVFGDSPPFEFPAAPVGPRPVLRDILEQSPDRRYTLSDHLWKYLQNYAQKHKAKGNGFGFGLANPDSIARTLSARYFKDGSEILVQQEGRPPRRLTPRECARLMGFDDDYPVVVSDTQAYRQFGNAVVPKVAGAVARQIMKTVSWHLTQTDNNCLIKKPANGLRHGAVK